jgi:hypothetical protein
MNERGNGPALKEGPTGAGLVHGFSPQPCGFPGV